MKVTIEATEKVVKLAKEAYAVQDACNLCGVAQRFAKVMIELNGSPCRLGNHPITRMWLDKLVSLTPYRQDFSGMSEVYRQNRELMEGRDVEVDK